MNEWMCINMYLDICVNVYSNVHVSTRRIVYVYK